MKMTKEENKEFLMAYIFLTSLFILLVGAAYGFILFAIKLMSLIF